MIWNNKYTNASEAIFCSLGFMVFSFFIHYEFPFRMISFAALALPAYFISCKLQSISDFRKMMDQSVSFKITFLYCLGGSLSGVLLAIFYRWYLDVSLFPGSIHLFVFIAALIGILEELVFRGFIQETIKNRNGLFSVFFSALSHTGYKCCLFLSPAVYGRIDIGFLALWTFVAGLIFGSLKHFSKSVLPSAIAHALFDILVYAEFISAPWWVW
jgi:membrane protease YdiL (CAAX protease family)